MIFYALTGIAVGAIIVTIVRACRTWHGLDSDDWATIAGVVFLWGVFAWGGTSFVQAATPATYSSVEQRGLTALATRTDQPGSYFFLGTGVVDEKEVYRYIERAADGGNRMEDVRVHQAVVYETDEAPHMEIVRSYSDRWWLTPWPVQTLSGTEYRFHIPEGSIARSFEVTP